MTPLADAFEVFGERGMFALYAIPLEGDRCAKFELAGGETEKDPETATHGMLDVIEALDAANASIWKNCTKCEFNIGFQCGIQPQSIEHRLSNALMRRIVDFGAKALRCIAATDLTISGLRASLNPPAAGSPSSGRRFRGRGGGERR
jgi:hypothetical protein